MRTLFAGLAATLLIALAASGARAQSAEDELLPVEQAFKLGARVDTPGQVALHWEIAPDYYLYRGRIHAKIVTSGVTAGALSAFRTHR